MSCSDWMTISSGDERYVFPLYTPTHGYATFKEAEEDIREYLHRIIESGPMMFELPFSKEAYEALYEKGREWIVKVAFIDGTGIGYREFSAASCEVGIKSDNHKVMRWYAAQTSPIKIWCDGAKEVKKINVRRNHELSIR